MKTVKTIAVTTPHRTFTLPAVTSAYNAHYGKTYYTTHVYNSMGQAITGGSNFPASNAKTCAHYGVPHIAKG